MIVVLLLLLLSTIGFGAVLTSPSGTISFNVVSETSLAQWTVSPPSATSIQIVFTAMKIDIAELRIYDSTDSTGTSLLACVYCGSTIPPPFSSSAVFLCVFL